MVTEEAESLLRAYYQYLRLNPRVSKDRKSVRMLESLIRLSEAHARLLMKSEASVFDAVSVVVLIEHTLLTCLFGTEAPPSVMFKDHHEYLEIKNVILIRLGLDPSCFEEDWKKGEIQRALRIPSPIKRLEDSMFMSGKEMMDLTYVSQNTSLFRDADAESVISLTTSGGR